MMWTVFGSVALHLTWRKIEYREYKERTAHKINVLKEITHCLENKEEIKQSLRNEIKSVIRNEHAEEDEEGVLVKLLQSTEPEPTPEKIKDTSEGKWFEQKKVYL
ncbi:hypothetical protein G6F56_008224 [Rhizopus delemar]|uniref:Uncharacterized protein n=1 Tax=Rhizopus stolonifer TaxID=4846 RepID=A0A367IRJ2_RHIST|nr:hypothetical protein G6F56_008224 [Rhizopus delemar]RCH80298.1 hypothetical protein CU098_006023 [Rhizopus stolonifer]